MNKLNTLLAALLFAVPVFAQEEVETGSEEGTEETVVFEEEGSGEPDTTRMNVGNSEFIIITKSDDNLDEIDLDFDNDEKPRHRKKSEAHWAGLDFGVTMLMNENFEHNSFNNNPYWNNDAARSQVWNLNLMEHKFNFGTPYVGITTGLGFSFTSVALRNNYLIQSTADTVFAVADTINTFAKNKMKSTYLTVPLMLEFNTNADSDRSFYLAAGVVGGVRLTSRLKRKGEVGGADFKERIKADYNLNSFKLDAAARLGYGSWGVFANYSLLPLFDEGATVDVYPLTFGLSLNF
jgi:hypothetical protein